MLKKSFAAVAVALAGAAFAEPVVMIRFASSQTRSIEEWRKTAQAFAVTRGCCDDVWFSTGESFPSLGWHRNHLACLREAAKDMRELGIGVSLQFEATIGHGDNFPTDEEKAIFDKPWTGWTGPDGVECRYCNCPRQPGFLKRIAEVSELYAEIKPDVVWIDDDLRLGNHDPMVGKDAIGCWCAKCLADFSAETGTKWTREDLRAACAKDAKTREAWHDFSARSLAAVAVTCARAFRKVSPQTRLGLQSATDRGRANAIILRALAETTGEKPSFRAGGGAYYDDSAFAQIGKSWDLAAGRKACPFGDLVGKWCNEVESYPRAYGSRSAKSIAIESFAALAWGFDSTSLFVMDRRSETDGTYARNILWPLRETTQFLNRYSDANRGTRPAGFDFPVSGGDSRILAGIPFLPGPGASWGEISPERAAYPGLGLALWGDIRTDRVPDYQRVPSAKLQAVRERLGGAAPVKVCSPYVGTVMPRVDASGAVRTIGFIGARFDRQLDIVVSVDTPCVRATWHELGANPLDLTGELVNGRRQFTIQSLNAWNVGYLTLDPLDEGFLPPAADVSSWSEVYRRVAEADAAADARWRNVTDRAEYDAARREMRAKFKAALGPLPERTPLNFRSVRTFQRKGYRVEHVVFESMPGLLVPANLFVPEDPAFKAPYPAVVLSCGHGRKDVPLYRRACVDVVRRGMVALMFEPYEQGERVEYPQYNCCQNHNLIGLKAMLLGSSMAALRIWDGVRAIDCAQELPYVDKARIGYMGQSGGGTMTSLMESFDDRIAAAAPSGYLTSFSFLCRTMGPQDAEQNVFGQLAFGLNHTGYALLSDAKVLVTATYEDMFAYGGTAQLMETVRDVAGKTGRAEEFALNAAPGPHGWTEATLQGSAEWMSAWLQGRSDLLPFQNGKYRLDNLGFSTKTVDVGLADDECGVFAGESPFARPGARDIHQILREKFARARAARPVRSAAETAAVAKRRAGVLDPPETGFVVKEVAARVTDGLRLTQLAIVYPSGFALPAVLAEPAKGPKPTSAVLLAGTRGRAVWRDRVREALAAGKSALVLDVTGTGEIGGLVHPFYGARETPEEGISLMLHLLGESMVGRRATELVFAADWLRARTGRAVSLEAEGSVAIAAAHAYAAARDCIADVRVTNAPSSWTAFLEKAGAPYDYRFTYCVNGALLDYDWIDLVSNSKKENGR